MATNHTTNYQLNLWEPGDSFLREEFNQNSQKIDAALGALAGAAAAAATRVKLLELTSTQNSQQVDLDVSSIDWTAWACLELHSCMPGQVQNDSMTSELRVNGGSFSYLGGIQNVLSHGMDHGLFSRLWLKWDGGFLFAVHRTLKAHYASTLTFSDTQGAGVLRLSAAPQTLSMVLNTSGTLSPSDNYYLPGSRLTLWGIK